MGEIKMIKEKIDEKKIDDILSRSVAEILPGRDDLKKLMLSGKKLRIYIGTDPTGTSLHLGHATNYIILEKFRRLGHKVIFLIGDFTARIGDPSGEKSTRNQLTREDVIKNNKTWLKQVEPLIALNDENNPVEIRYNDDWYANFSFEDVINLAGNFTVQQMLERDMFQNRLKEEKPIYVHEIFYPMMQGYDSVMLDVDIELCGRDQTFNALMGRILQKKYNNKEKFVITTTLLENPVTHEKMMSKSRGTGIYLDEDAKSMFGKIMAQPDENIYQLFVDCTYLDIQEINQINSDIQEGVLNPRDAKLRLAYEIAKIYHGSQKADEVKDDFINVFSNKELPKDMPELVIESNLEYELLDILKDNKLISSKSDGRRLLEQGGISVDGKKIDTSKLLVKESGVEMVIKIGKRKWIRILTK